ncbi:MAG: isoaspartyl peptidase/L-asparaginase [Cytophagales bacterium]|nr:isoaspartyl peptidase/L-asparaginase [Cytophagales bacterium]
MRNSLIILLLSVFNPVSYAQDIALVIHGGSGNIYRENLSDSLEGLYREKLYEALISGYEILLDGGTSQEAVKKAINIMEDSPLFNAGKGAVFTNAGTNEMDASIMDGSTLNAGAVAGVKQIKNPINAAIDVMNYSPHVMMTGDGAEAFAKMRGLEIVDASYFYTERRHMQLMQIKERESTDQGNQFIKNHRYKFGTVGAVALDKSGNMVAGTSTGGMTNKKYGRVGDSPIIGAGTYANNKTCGISATGHGEYFIRGVVAYDISALMEYTGLSIQEAADLVIHEKLAELGGVGGVIGLDAKGNVMMSFNSNGMFRGFIKQKGNPQIFIFKE